MFSFANFRGKYYSVVRPARWQYIPCKPPDAHNKDYDLLAWEADSGPQWLGGAITTLLWLIAAGFWHQDPLIAGFSLFIAGVVAVTGALLTRLGNLATAIQKTAPWLSAAAFTLIATRLALY